MFYIKKAFLVFQFSEKCLGITIILSLVFEIIREYILTTLYTTVDL